MPQDVRHALRRALKAGNPFEMQAAAERALHVFDAARVEEDNYPNAIQRATPPLRAPYEEMQFSPNLIMVVGAVPVVAPQATSPGEELRFSGGSGLLIGWRGTVWDTTPGALASGPLEMATMAFQAALNDDTNLITNGTGQDFVPFGTMFSPTQVWSPLLRRVTTDDIATFRFRNLQPVGASSLQASLTFAFLRDPRDDH